MAKIAGNQIFRACRQRDFQERLVITIRKTMAKRNRRHRFAYRSKLLQETVNPIAAKAEGRP
jgi:hypothetical protein